MSMSQSSNRRRVIAGVSLVALSVAFLSNRMIGLMTAPASPSQTSLAIVGFLAVANAVLMTGAMLGLSQLLRASADAVGLLGAASTLVGWAASTRISAVIQLDALMRAGVEGVPPSAIESAFKSSPVVWVSMFPVGLFFPLGLITLGIALFWWRPVNRWFGLLLALGGVLFPLGRAVGIEFAVIASDIVLAASFAAMGWQILTRPEVWEATPGRSETMKRILSSELQAGA
ncbi:MAG TPA: hypothetical protein VGB05_07855 [Pyrinomonadaceae bacterium]